MNTRSRFTVNVLAALAGIALTACSDQAKNAKHISRGDAFLEAGDLDAARIEYMNVIRRDQKNVEVLEKIGTIWYEQGVPLKAYPFFGAALEVDPENVSARRKMANVLFSIGQVEQGIEAAGKVLDAVPDDGEALLLLANASRSPEALGEVQQRLQGFDPAGASYNIASAILAARGGDAAGMKEALDRAVAADPDSVQVQLALAIYYQATGDVERLREALAKAAAASPPRSATHLRYARFLADSGERPEAITVVQGVTTSAPDYVPAWVTLADLNLAENRIDEATTAIENALRRDPNNPDALVGRARVLTAEGKNAEALETFRELDSMFPRSPMIKLNLARSFIRDGDLVQAAAALATAIEISNEENAEAILLLAQVDIRRGEAWAAAEALEKLVANRPELGQAQVLLSQAYQAQGRLDDAADIFRRQLAAGTEHPMPHFLLGTILRQQGENEEALAQFEKAQDYSPNDQTITFQLVETDALLGDFDSARQRALAVIERDETDWGGHFLLGKVLTLEERWDEAEQSLLKALELKPGSPTVYDLLVEGYLMAGKTGEAIARIEAGLEENPDDVGRRTLLARLYTRDGERTKAIETYEAVLQVAPDSPDALNNLAYLLGQSPDGLSRAAELAAKARALRPEEPGIADTLGWILYQQGEFPQALALIEEAASKSADDPEIKYHLGLARIMMGRDAPGREALEESAAAGAEFTGSTDLEEKMALLEASSTEPIEAWLADQAADPFALLLLGRMSEGGGQAEVAADAYTRALASHPKSLAAQLGLARLYSGELDSPEKALASAQSAVSLAPTDPEATGLRGRVAFQQGDFQKAFSFLQQATRDRVGGDPWQIEFARAAYSIGKLNEARAAMRTVADAPSAEQADREEATRFLELTSKPDQGGWGSLAQAAEARLASDPDDVPSLMVRARVLALEGQTEKAATVYEDILRRFPEFAHAKGDLAAIYLDDPTKLEQALELAARAREALPGDPGVARTLGTARYLRGQFAPAIPLLEEAGRSQSLDAEGEFLLGMAYAKSNQADRGRSHLETALANGLAEPMATEARDALAELAGGE